MKKFIFLLMASLLITPALASDWGMFKKDMSHSGFTTDAVNPPLTVAWTFDLGFDSDSSPIIVNDVLYVGSNYGIHAIDAKSGRELWRTHTNGFVKSAPTVADGVLYVGADDRWFYAMDIKDGAMKWIYKNATDGYTSSSIVVNNLAYTGSKDGSFYAFDIQKGEPARQTLTGKVIESSPALGDGIFIFGSNGGLIIAIDAATGKQKWSYDTGPSDIKSSPLIAGGTVFVGSDDGSIYALATTNGTLKWKYPTGSNVQSSPSYKDGTIFVGSRDSNLYAIDASTGTLKWKSQTAGYVDTSPAISNDIVYFGSRNNFIYGLDANTGKLLWRNSTGQNDKDYITSPAISGNMLYAVTHSGVVYAYSGAAVQATQATPAATPAVNETTATPAPTLSPTVTPTATKKTPGFEFPVVVLLILVLIRKRHD
ncbi:MAG: PQQ-binding-like beta-propeller repeat protein [Candidatus Methanoperedens sp.]|nr:PQQ-binding-like beta-propeller repeat protein [Candidatus Methanoperedens sp.]